MKKYTQIDLVLAVLQIKGSVTTDELIALGVSSPSAVIHKLRSTGCRIKTKYVPRKCKKKPLSLRQAEYTLLAQNLATHFVKRNQGGCK